MSEVSVTNRIRLVVKSNNIQRLKAFTSELGWDEGWLEG